MKMKMRSARYAVVFLALFVCVELALGSPPAYDVHIDCNAAKQLAIRVLGVQLANNVDFESLPHTGDAKHVFEFESRSDGGLVVRGSNTAAMTAGLGWYLKHYANVHISWSGNQLERVKHGLPKVTAKVQRERVVEYTYYMNVCTLSYSMIWWDWSRWERELDWMALSGVNVFLASVGQEYVWRALFRQVGMYDDEIASYFTGPAFLAWQRMGNIQAWGGPLPNDFIDAQHILQSKILVRSQLLGIVPILPAFAGHVPMALTRIYPDAKIARSSPWGAFNSTYTPVYMVEPTDPLFVELGSKFLKLQRSVYDLDIRIPRLYGADTFNEMRPKSSKLSYLRQAAAAMGQSLTEGDKDAVWVMQGWLFQDTGFWTSDRIDAYLSGIDDDRLIVLDLFSEVSPIYPRISGGFFGKRWIWNELHNFGGNHGLYGRLQVLSTEPLRALEKSNRQMIGVGMTPEGINQNFVVYEFLTEMAFYDKSPELKAWVEDYATRRYGASEENAKAAWNELLQTVYTSKSMQFGVTKSLFVLRPSLSTKTGLFMTTKLFYDPKRLEDAARSLLEASDRFANVETYQYDLIDVVRQVLSNRFLIWHNAFVQAYHSNDVSALQSHANAMLGILTDIDKLLNSNQHFMLGGWLQSARSLAGSKKEMELFEFNARNQITLWGPRGEIADYASKQFAGLVEDYYRPRWKLFFGRVIEAVESKKAFDVRAFSKECFLLELSWQRGTKCYAVEPIYNSVDVATSMLEKYTSISARYSNGLGDLVALM